MTRPLLFLAALYNFAWVGILLAWPERIVLKPPPLFGLLIALIGLVGGVFAVCAVKPRRDLLGIAILAKLGGPPCFLAGVALGYLAWRQWWMPVFNDLIWLPPLFRIWKQTVRS
jgi:hypothetical protein